MIDVVRGAGPLHGANQILFHPSCSLDVRGGKAVVRHEDRGMYVIPIEGTSPAMVEAWYAPNFGIKQRTHRLVLGASANQGRLVMVCALRPGTVADAFSQLRLSGNHVVITDRGSEPRWAIPSAD